MVYRAPRTCISNEFPGDAEAVDWRPHFETTALSTLFCILCNSISTCSTLLSVKAKATHYLSHVASGLLGR